MSTFQFTTIEPAALQETIAATIKTHIQAFMAEQKNELYDELLTREEAAKFFKVNISTVNNWRKAGKIICYGIGGRMYYRRSELMKCLIKINSVAQ